MGGKFRDRKTEKGKTEVEKGKREKETSDKERM